MEVLHPTNFRIPSLYALLGFGIGLLTIIQSTSSETPTVPRTKWATHRKAIGKGIYQTITCENGIWNNRLACPRGLEIGNILDAKYGRYLGGDICPFGGYFVDDPPCSKPVYPMDS